MKLLKQSLADGEKIRLLAAIIGGVSLLFSSFDLQGALPFDPAWVAVILCGLPIFKGAVLALITRFDVKADLLVSIALVAAVIINEVLAAGEVAFIMALGSLLEERTIHKARDGIEKLVNMTPRTARVLRDGTEVIIRAEEVRADDVLRVLPGEIIAVDGVLVFGQTAVDESLMTGECLPVDKTTGEEVFSGTINQFGTFDMRATRVGEDSSLQRMIRLVESADASKTPIVRVMDRWATWIVAAALLASLGTWAITGEAIRAVTILVVFCPCALVLSTPTAVMAGIGRATRYGVLLSSGDSLERLAKVNTAAFDKTGTLTHGKPEVVAVVSDSSAFSEAELLALAATVEQRSEHPLARAVVGQAKKEGLPIAPLEQFAMVPGKGIQVVTGGRQMFGGNLHFIQENGIALSEKMTLAATEEKKKGGTVIYIGAGNAVLGIIALNDTVRPDARSTIERLHKERVETVLLTGDHAESANAIAGLVGIREVHADLLPEDKVRLIRGMSGENQRRLICMIGDGVNDAPALKSAYIGLAMGGVGSGIAIDAADGVFVRDDIKHLPQLFQLAKKTLTTIKINITISMLLNFFAVSLAATGIMGPVAGALVHNAGALLVVLNSARLLNDKDKSEQCVSKGYSAQTSVLEGR